MRKNIASHASFAARNSAFSNTALAEDSFNAHNPLLHACSSTMHIFIFFFFFNSNSRRTAVVAWLGLGLVASLLMHAGAMTQKDDGSFFC